MIDVYYVQREEGYPDTAEPYLFKLCILPSVDDVSVG